MRHIERDIGATRDPDAVRGRAASTAVRRQNDGALPRVVQVADGGPETAAVAAELMKLGEQRWRERDFRSALEFFGQALGVLERVHGENAPQVLDSLNRLAGTYVALEEYSLAEPLLVRALAITEREYGSAHQQTALALSRLARVYFKRGAHTLALPLLSRVLAIKEAMLGVDHSEVAAVLESLAVVYHALGEFSVAEAMRTRELEIRERHLASDDPALAVSLEHLAESAAAAGDLHRAITLRERALSIRESATGSDDPALIPLRSAIAELKISFFAARSPFIRQQFRNHPATLRRSPSPRPALPDAVIVPASPVGADVRAIEVYETPPPLAAATRTGIPHPPRHVVIAVAAVLALVVVGILGATMRHGPADKAAQAGSSAVSSPKTAATAHLVAPSGHDIDAADDIPAMIAPSPLHAREPLAGAATAEPGPAAERVTPGAVPAIRSVNVDRLLRRADSLRRSSSAALRHPPLVGPNAFTVPAHPPRRR